MNDTAAIIGGADLSGALSGAADLEARVIVVAPTARDGDLARAVLGRHGIASHASANLADACAQLSRGAGALLVAEEALGHREILAQWLEQQPAWSDLPILLLARPGADSTDLAFMTQQLGNTTVLERPTRVSALVSAAQSALRARQRQHQIRRHLEEREESEQKLRANDRRKDEFLAILAHELRNPLAPISNALQLLQLSRSPNEQTAAMGQMMERQVGNLTRLVDDLLEVSRVTRGDVELRLERVELSQVIRTAVEASQPLMAAANHHLEVILPERPVYLLADHVRLAQVVSNILNNAAKYTDRGGRILLAAERDDGGATITVTDNGIGIPLEEQAKVFELFVQVDRARNRSKGGLGIGLTLVKRLVELHDGTVEVSSGGRGAGTQFKVRLPVSDKLPAAQAGDSDAPAADLSHLHVLVADDNRDAANSLGMLLEVFGARVRIAYGGAEALMAVDLQKFDAAVLDVGMPDVDGLEVARRIRALPQAGEMQLIALTGWGQAQDVQATREAGFDHHLVKPVDTQQLLAHLGQMMALARSPPPRGELRVH